MSGLLTLSVQYVWVHFQNEAIHEAREIHGRTVKMERGRRGRSYGENLEKQISRCCAFDQVVVLQMHAGKKFLLEKTVFDFSTSFIT